MKTSAVVLVWLLIFLTLSAFGQETIQSLPPEKADTVKAVEAKVRREVFDAAKHPALTAVGRINFIGGSWCSAILVAEDIAVTAGHCILKANRKFDIGKDLDPFWTSVNFKPDGVTRLEGVNVKRVLKAKLQPDYAIVQLSKKIPAASIKPLKFSDLSFEEISADEASLGCAGFNGDRELGGGGLLMTISRNVRVLPESSSKKRIDASCFSTYGGSGGLFFREQNDAENNSSEYQFLGVIWGLTDEKLNEKGELVKLEEVITSITPVGAFYDELTAILKKSPKSQVSSLKSKD